MFKKLVSLLLCVAVLCTFAFTVAAAPSKPDFVNEMPVPKNMLFSTSSDKSLDLLSATLSVPKDFTSFIVAENTTETYGFNGDFYVQFDWSIDKCAWSFTKDWNNVENKNTLTYKLDSNLMQEFEIFDLTLESDLERFSQGIEFENNRDAFYYPDHELSIRARFIFVYGDGENNDEQALYSEWSEGFSVNDDYYNLNSRTVNVVDLGLPSIATNITYKKSTDASPGRFSFDWDFDDKLEDIAFNLYAINGESLEIQEQICIGKNGEWIDIETDVSDTPYTAGHETVNIDDAWTENDNYFKYRMRYYYPGDNSNNLMSFHSPWSDSIIFENDKFTLVNETDDTADVGNETEAASQTDSDSSNRISPIVYIILIFVLLCFLFGILTSIGETRRQRKEAMEKAGLKKDKKKKNK